MATTTASDLTQRITLQRPVATVNGLGEEVQTWEDVATVWARVQPLRGRDFFAAAQMQSSTDHRVVIRYRADVLATWRVVWRGLVLEVVGDPINVDGARTWLELMCASGVRSGK